jgi:hypothetical protein
MTTYKPGDEVPREELLNGMRVRVEFEGVIDGGSVKVAATPTQWIHLGQFPAIRIVLLEAPDPDADIVEALSKTRYALVRKGTNWATWDNAPRDLQDKYREYSRQQLALLRELGVVIDFKAEGILP